MVALLKISKRVSRVFEIKPNYEERDAINICYIRVCFHILKLIISYFWVICKGKEPL